MFSYVKWPLLLLVGTVSLIGVYQWNSANTPTPTTPSAHQAPPKTAIPSTQQPTIHHDVTDTLQSIAAEHTKPSQITPEALIAKVERTLETTQDTYDQQLPPHFHETQATIDAELENYAEEAQQEFQAIIAQQHATHGVTP